MPEEATLLSFSIGLPDEDGAFPITFTYYINDAPSNILSANKPAATYADAVDMLTLLGEFVGTEWTNM